MLREIERYTGQRLTPAKVPTRPMSRRGAWRSSGSVFSRRCKKRT
jgi:hypothetical protein